MIVRATVSRINTQKYLIFVRSVDDDIRRPSYRHTRSLVEILHWSYSKINMSVFGYYLTVHMTVDSVYCSTVWQVTQLGKWDDAQKSLRHFFIQFKSQAKLQELLQKIRFFATLPKLLQLTDCHTRVVLLVFGSFHVTIASVVCRYVGWFYSREES